MYIHQKIKDLLHCHLRRSCFMNINFPTFSQCSYHTSSFCKLNNNVISCVQGKVEERKPLLVLFSDDAMKIILNTAA